MALLDYHLARFDKLLAVYKQMGNPRPTNKQLREALERRAKLFCGTLDDETRRQLSDYFTKKNIDED